MNKRTREGCEGYIRYTRYARARVTVIIEIPFTSFTAHAEGFGRRGRS